MAFRHTLAALAHRKAMRDALIQVMDNYNLDVLAMPLKTIPVPDLDDPDGAFGSDSRIHSVTELPSIVVPRRYLSNKLSAGFMQRL